MEELRAVRGRSRGRSWPLPRGARVVAGRGADCAVQLDDAALSREHFALISGSDGWIVEDLGSHNGTFLNGRRLRQPELLRHLDLISAGRHQLAFFLLPSQEPTEVIAGAAHCERCGCLLDGSIERALGLPAFGPSICAICRQLDETQPEPPPGRTELDPQPVGPFRLHGPLGAGASGMVYKAWDTRHDRWLALKLLFPREVGTLAIQRFLEESRIVASLDHPGIVRCLEVGQVERMLYIALEHVEGPDLEAHLQRHGPAPAARALDWGARICDALAHAHGRGVLHRDLKPANVLLEGERTPRIIDFGLGRALDRSGLRLTLSCNFLGTPQYMSPEQIDNVKQVDHRTDIYAAGVLLYRLLAGRSPFTTPRRDLMALYRAKERGQLPPLEGVPREIERLVAWAMAPDPAARPQGAAELASALRQAARTLI